MISIPSDLYEEHLSLWINQQLTNPENSSNEKIFRFLLKLSSCQMMDRERGEEYPYIMDFNPTDEELSFMLDNSFDKSDNAEICAYSLDLLQQKAKDKRQAQIDASSAYLELFDKTDSPWFLLRAVTVRTIKVINSLDFVKEVNIRLVSTNSSWFPKICKHLCISYKPDELAEVRKSIEQLLERFSNPKDKSDRRNERNCLEALEVLHVIDRNSLNRLMAISFEKEMDYLNSIKNEHTIHMGLERIAQDAYKEIAKVKDIYPEDYARIRNKLTKEQSVMLQ